MYDNFKYERIALSDIRLDDRNPRIVTQEKLDTEDAIIEYFFENEQLASFIKTIATERRNNGAERPYVVKDSKGYVVIEGNTRIATYKLLTGQCTAPLVFRGLVPAISEADKAELANVDVTIAPSRDALMTIMARAHFGRGDKSKWGYLGSRKAVYDDRKAGKSIADLADIFGRPQSKIREFLIEYMLYLEAVNLNWTPAEKDILLKPSVEFNPPVRFLQTAGHKEAVGIELDNLNLKIKFIAPDAKAKFKHLVKRQVIDRNGLRATATYEEAFKDFGLNSPTSNGGTSSSAGGTNNGNGNGGSSSNGGGGSGGGNPSRSGPESDTVHGGNNDGDAEGGDGSVGGAGRKPNTLFNYPVKQNDAILQQLMKEAKGLNIKNYPAAGTVLLRGILESLLKLIIAQKNLNNDDRKLDMESALSLVIGQGKLGVDTTKVLKEFQKQHCDYINLSSHGSVVPNFHRLVMARDCIDAFVKRNV
jgi:hypothetical protein